MKNAINWFEIPALDMDRAVRFYETLLGTKLQRMSFMEIPHAIFPAAEGGVSGAIVKDPNNSPARVGCNIFLNVETDLQTKLARVETLGGKMLLPTTHIGDMGWIALIEDSEGNRIGLHHY